MIAPHPYLRRAAVALTCCAVLAGCGDDATSSPGAAGSGAAAPARLVERPFSASSPWNQQVDGLPRDPDSAALLRRAALRAGVLEREGDSRPRVERRRVTSGLVVNTSAWTAPVVSGGVVTPLRCRQRACGSGEPVRSLRIPAGVDPDPRYDGWLTVIEGRTAYDLWRARRERDGAISYQFIRAWDLQGDGQGLPGQAGTRGSGLPLIAGLIGARELETGSIDHALAIAVPGPAQRRYVRPASTTNGDGLASSLPEGARIRLRADVRPEPDQALTRRQQRARDAIIVALRRYGAIVVDRAAVPTLYAARGVAGDALAGDELGSLTLDDFEVVRLGRVQLDPSAADGGIA